MSSQVTSPPTLRFNKLVPQSHDPLQPWTCDICETINLITVSRCHKCRRGNPLRKGKRKRKKNRSKSGSNNKLSITKKYNKIDHEQDIRSNKNLPQNTTDTSFKYYHQNSINHHKILLKSLVISSCPLSIKNKTNNIPQL